MSWFRNPVNIAITIGAAILALVVIALIIYGVTTHREPILMEVCWEGNEARYVEGTEVDDGACEGAEELVWPQSQLPFAVAATKAADETVLAPGTVEREGLDAAIRDINQQLGCTVLRASADPLSAAMVAHLGEAVDVLPRGVGGRTAARAPLGWAHHDRSNSGSQLFLRCHLHVRSNVGSLRGEYLVAHHELLHCLGLAHDPDNPASAIYPFTEDDTMWDQMQAARITDADRARLRGLYCHAPMDSLGE